MSGSGGVSVRASAGPRLDRGARAHLRRAVRRAAHLRGRASVEGGERPPVSWVCATCGQLAWPEAADPHRGEPGRPPAVSAACSHCGDRAWIDLGDASTALVISERDHHPVRSLVLSVVFYALAGLVVGTVLAAVGFWLEAAAWMGGIGAVLGAIGAFRLGRGRAEAPATLPVRWSMSLPPAETPAESLVGVIAGADGIVAPISGRACLAYEVAVRGDPDADAPLPTWSLVEQHVAPFELDGRRFEGAGVHLDVEREYLGEASTIELSPAALAFFEQRGIAPGADTLHVFESVIRGGDGVVLRYGSQGATLGRRRALAAAEAPSA